jgi:TRAP-type C4-dicarboxylate transport system substrate-binding protein
MKAIRTGKNPDHKRLQQLDKAKQKAVKQAADKAARKRKGTHRAGGNDDVIDTGMFR